MTTLATLQSLVAIGESETLEFKRSTAELLPLEHRSIPRNPLIPGAFHRTGAIDVWDRGSNRVIETCRAYGIAKPTFAEASGAVTVTFEADVAAGASYLVPGGHAYRTTVRKQGLHSIRLPHVARHQIDQDVRIEEATGHSHRPGRT